MTTPIDAAGIVAAIIRPLVWHHYDVWTWWAECPSGTYQVEERNGGWRVQLRVGGLVHDVLVTEDTTPETLATAQAAAEQDYRARIAAALDVGPILALVGQLEAWLNIAAHCNITDGSCCCGDDMERHPSPMNCGHSPVDHGSYVADQNVKSTEAALAALTGGPSTLRRSIGRSWSEA